MNCIRKYILRILCEHGIWAISFAIITFSFLILQGCTADFDDETDFETDEIDSYLENDSDTVTDDEMDSNPDADSAIDKDTSDTESDQEDTSPSIDPEKDVFTPDSNTLAIFELNGDVKDSSGNGRHGTLIGGTFVNTDFGQGLSMSGDPQGFSWGYPSLIKPDFTIEMVLIPRVMSDYQKLFGYNDKLDNGWYYYSRSFEAWPNGTIGSGFIPNTRHYLAIVSTSASKIDVYMNGTFIGSTGASLAATLDKAIFFRDDTDTSRSEFFNGVADAVRISDVARTSGEIKATQTLLNSRPYGG